MAEEAFAKRRKRIVPRSAQPDGQGLPAVEVQSQVVKALLQGAEQADDGTQPSTAAAPTPQDGPAEALSAAAKPPNAASRRLKLRYSDEGVDNGPSSQAQRKNQRIWAQDPTGHWEVWVRNDDSAGIVVQGVRRADASIVWEYGLLSDGLQLAVSDSFAAVATAEELHVLSLSSGLLVLPPIVLASRPAHLVFSTQVQLSVLGRDASLIAWDLSSLCCTAQTSLRHVCNPKEIRSIGTKPQTGEPILELADGRLLLFCRSLRSWVTLRNLEEHAMPNTGAAAVGGSRSSSSRKECNLTQKEGDLLSAACLADAAEVQRRFAALVHACAEGGAPSAVRLRAWCTSLLECRGGGAPAVAGLGQWLARELSSLGLESQRLVHDTILPELRKAPGVQDLRAEIEEMCAAAPAPASAIF